MIRQISAVLLIVIAACPVSAEIFWGNARLDHALWPEHEAKLVVAGEISNIDTKPRDNPDAHFSRDVSFQFKVKGVILGKESDEGKTLTVPASHFMWPSDLVPFEEKAYCILVLGKSTIDNKEDYYISAVVPARKQSFTPVDGSAKARESLAKELVAHLKNEKSETRQRALLMQLAPILMKEQAEDVEVFLESKDPWVKRAALAGLIYATERSRYVKAAATDVQKFLNETKKADLIDGLEKGIKQRPASLLFEHYFFLEKTTRTPGTRWNWQEADKHIRILRAMYEFDIIDADVKKLIDDE